MFSHTKSLYLPIISANKRFICLKLLKKGQNNQEVFTTIRLKKHTFFKLFSWEMNKEERVAHAMKKRAESDSDAGLKTIADLFGNLKNKQKLQ